MRKIKINSKYLIIQSSEVKCTVSQFFQIGIQNFDNITFNFLFYYYSWNIPFFRMRWWKWTRSSQTTGSPWCLRDWSSTTCYQGTRTYTGASPKPAPKYPPASPSSSSATRRAGRWTSPSSSTRKSSEPTTPPGLPFGHPPSWTLSVSDLFSPLAESPAILVQRNMFKETVYWKEMLFAGNDVILPCKSVGNPKPTLIWIDPNGRVIDNDDRFTILPDGELKIKSIIWADMGIYTCVVKNSVGDDTVETFLYPLKVRKNILILKYRKTPKTLILNLSLNNSTFPVLLRNSDEL